MNIGFGFKTKPRRRIKPPAELCQRSGLVLKPYFWRTHTRNRGNTFVRNLSLWRGLFLKPDFMAYTYTQEINKFPKKLLLWRGLVLKPAC